jgi:hypothetical protein
VTVLPDGVHDVLIIDATPDTSDSSDIHAGGGQAEPRNQTWVLDLAIVAGPHKGEVVSVRANNLEGDDVDLMGMPATLTVTDGQPAVRVDR